MESITIEVEGEELETIKIELTSEEVRAIYKLRKEQSVKIEELEKSLKSVEQSKKYEEEKKKELENQINQANMLLTALGVEDKTNEEESYYRKEIPVATRIALYIARVNNASLTNGK